MWQLKSLRINLMDYGEYKGKHTGEIAFSNGDKEAFTCSLTPNECAEYLSIVQKKVGDTATQLGNKIAESFKEMMLPATPILEIGNKD